MSFPPNLGITTSFFIDSTGSLLIQELPSLLPQLEHICSPFSYKHRMNGYSRIKKHTSARSKSVDFADLSIAHRTPTSPAKFSSQEMKPNPRHAAVKITTVLHDPIPEMENEDEAGEVFGIILGRKCSDQKAVSVDESSTCAAKRSLSIKRSASLSDGYSRIHHQGDLTKHGDEFCSHDTEEKKKNKKGKLFRAFRHLFGL